MQTILKVKMKLARARLVAAARTKDGKIGSGARHGLVEAR